MFGRKKLSVAGFSVPPTREVVSPSQQDARLGRYETAVWAMAGAALVFTVLNVLLTIGTLNRMDVVPYVTDGSVYGCLARVLTEDEMTPPGASSEDEIAAVGQSAVGGGY